MFKKIAFTLCLLVSIPMGVAWSVGPTSGNYIEARTCQIYTGPCFANGEVGSAGKDAVMAWQINKGGYDEIDLSGLEVAIVVKSSHTLGFQGIADAKTLKAMIFVDADASSKQATALQSFALAQSGIKPSNVVAVKPSAIEMQFDTATLNASVTIGNLAKVSTRKARAGDCICSNEAAYYPPLAKLTGFVPGVTIEGDVTARALGSRWSIPDSRTAYIGVFKIDPSKNKLAAK